MNCDFTLKHYEETLEKFLKNGFESLLISEFFLGKKFQKSLIMRHDIDHDIELIQKMIEVESSVGIKSSNFFRIRAKNYNIFSSKSRKIIENVLSLDHEVGFHYEGDDINSEKFEKILELLRAEYGSETFKVVSPHEPSRTGNKFVKGAKNLGILGDAYDDKLLTEFKYISDSSCRWREGCMHEFIDSEKSMYILTHPIWWYEKETGENY